MHMLTRPRSTFPHKKYFFVKFQSKPLITGLSKIQHCDFEEFCFRSNGGSKLHTCWRTTKSYEIIEFTCIHTQYSPIALINKLNMIALPRFDANVALGAGWKTEPRKIICFQLTSNRKSMYLHQICSATHVWLGQVFENWEAEFWPLGCNLLMRRANSEYVCIQY